MDRALLKAIENVEDKVDSISTGGSGSSSSGIVTNEGKNMWMFTKSPKTEEQEISANQTITGSDGTVYKSTYQIIDNTTIYIKLYRTSDYADKFFGIAKYKIGGSDNINIIDIGKDIMGDYTTWQKIGTDSSNLPIYLKTVTIKINELKIPEEYQSERLTFRSEGISGNAFLSGLRYRTNYEESVLTYSKIRDILYPVGSIYTSTQNTLPDDFIGGIWESITAIATDTYSWKRTA